MNESNITPKKIPDPFNSRPGLFRRQRPAFALVVSVLLAFSGCQSIPVVYESESDTKPLAHEEKRYVLDWCDAFTPADQRVWYILVVFNRPPGFCTKVHFTPSVMTARIRMGKYIWVTPNEELNVLFELVPSMNIYAAGRNLVGFSTPVSVTDLELEAATTSPKPSRYYAQVSLPERPFDKNLGLPNVSSRPFTVFGDFTKDEIIRMVDLARKTLDPFGPTESILSVKKKTTSVSTVLLHTVNVANRLIRGGRSVGFARKEGKLVVVETGSWEERYEDEKQKIRLLVPTENSVGPKLERQIP